MEIVCFKLIAGDVLRYSQDGLIECFSNSQSGSFRLRKIVDHHSFKAELSMRSKRQEISHDYFLRVSETVNKNFSCIEENMDVMHCFNVIGGNATRFSNESLIERVKLNSNSCEIVDSIHTPYSFGECLKIHSKQYQISNQVFHNMKSEALGKIEDKCGDIDQMCSNKIQIELF